MEKEASCINSRAILDYLKIHDIDYAEMIKGLEPEIDRLEDPESFLRDPNNWISCGVVSKLFERATRLLDDDEAAYKIGRYVTVNTALGFAQRIVVKAFWSVKTGLKHCQKINDQWNRSKKVELIEMKRNEATVRLHWDPDMGTSKYICRYNQAVYTYLPRIWKGSPLRLREKCCFFDGAPYCEYHLKWPLRNRFHEIISRFFTSKSVLMDTIQEMERDKKVIDRKNDELRDINKELNKKITEHSQSEDALRESEERFRTLFEYAPDAYYLNDFEGNFIDGNKAAEELIGYTRKKLIGNSFLKLNLLPRSEMQKAASILAKNAMGQATGPDELTLKRGDGREVIVDIRAFPMKIKGQDLVLGIARDITDRKRAESILKQEAAFRQVLGDIANEFITTSPASIDESINHALASIGKFVGADRSYVITFDFQAGTISNTHEWCREGIEPQQENLQDVPMEVFSWVIDQLTDLQVVQIPKVAELPTEAAAAKEEFEAEGIRSLLLVPLVSEGNCFGTVGFDFVQQARSCSEREIKLLQMSGATLSNALERKWAEQALRESEEKLVRSKKMESLGLLAGGVAHDLNNVLSGIVSYPELLLLDLPEHSKLRKPIETMQESGHRAAAIVQDLLTVARGVATTKEPMNLNDLVGEYLKSPEFERLKHYHPTVTIQSNLDADLLNISGSHVNIRKVLMNLVSNASEAIEGNGNVTISTLNRYIDRPIKGYDDVSIGEYAVLAVSDDGSGISPNDLERIFEPFYTKKVMGRSGGTGLGLAVVWNVLHDHGGYIDVKSNEKGTRFELFFPITRDDISDQALSIPIQDYQGSGETILVVDDVESQRDISCKMLEALGYKAEAVSSGEEAVEYFKKNTADLILLDMIMDPGINGRETYERIITFHPNQKAIIVSGFAETDEVKETQELGAGKYIRKPLTLEKIGLAVKEELER